LIRMEKLFQRIHFLIDRLQWNSIKLLASISIPAIQFMAYLQNSLSNDKGNTAI
jgi:hypothetical protein